jgi:hypothetical protein
MIRQFRSYRIIKNSGLFDEVYYLRHNPDVRRSDEDPLTHFLNFGWKEDRDPSARFDISFYLQANPDVRESGMNPLLHYIHFGREEGRANRPVGDNSPDRYPKGITFRSSLGNENPPVTDLNPEDPQNIMTVDADRGETFIPGENPFYTLYSQKAKDALNEKDQSYCDFKQHDADAIRTTLKLIAFYLPQFYPMPENDAWWGKGFTEWTNVTKAVPQFIGHYQPHLPGELGYYDLRLAEVQERQVELARNYGIHGFCFYYYWFNGKRLLDRPLDLFTSNKKIDFPFCICWANENWTRRWDGLEDSVLISQQHNFKIDHKIIHDFIKQFKNPNYIRINGRPLLLIYRGDILNEGEDTLKYWRKECIKSGQGNPYIVVAQSFGYYDPRTLGFDAAVSFPPHDIKLKTINDRLVILNQTYNGQVWSYPEYVSSSIKELAPTPYTQFHSLFPNWDNEPRRPGRGMTFAFSSAEYYRIWLEHVCEHSLRQLSKDEKFVFVNAWNEWGEGAHLEPDRKYGYAYLEATYQALLELAKHV